jgi:oligoendopeptidase F
MKLPEIPVQRWEDVSALFEELVERPIASHAELKLWLTDRSELDAYLQEDLGWRYIRQTCDTTDESKREILNFFIQEIEPHLAKYADELNRKMLDSPFLSQLTETGYFVYLRGVKKEVELFREENIPLLTDIQTLGNEYGQISGSMTVELDDKTVTFQQAAVELKSSDRARRKEVYTKINERRLSSANELNSLFNKLLNLRHEVAVGANYENFRDYMFDALGRFDYTAQHCFDFHDSVAEHIVPIISSFESERKRLLGYDNLMPWDLEVDPELQAPLEPYKNSDDLIEKTIEVFSRVRPDFGQVIRLMQEKGHLDLDSRIGKAPGGYNYPLHRSSLPFIFMNSAGTMRDMVTMMHEGGHAVHSWLSKDLDLTAFKSTPSEIAEVASMAMELISMEHWDVFFQDAETLKRARKYQLEKILSILPWIATVDAFQHWLYLNPKHSEKDRQVEWIRIFRKYAGNVIDRSETSAYEPFGWHRQLHIFEVPFYYIEYGIAQLASIGIWKNYKTNPQKTLEQYATALTAGYTHTLPELYEMAGIKFDFSSEYIRELAAFVQDELNQLK